MKPISTLSIILFAIVLYAPTILAQSDTAKAPPVERVKFDPSRDAAKDIEVGTAEAKRTNRHVLLDVGGEWCIWCHRLDAFFADNVDVDMLMKKNFVVVKVNYSKENKNEEVLSRYPRVKGYPHLFVLDQDGRLLHSQDTGELEAGKGYDKSKMEAFLAQWAPATRN
jgi:thioredoxin-related protein